MADRAGNVDRNARSTARPVAVFTVRPHCRLLLGGRDLRYGFGFRRAVVGQTAHCAVCIISCASGSGLRVCWPRKICCGTPSKRLGAGIWPLCLALGATFAFELFFYAERLMMPGAVRSPRGTRAGRCFCGAVACRGDGTEPRLAGRYPRSRTLVLHTAALVASGVFCMSLAAAGLLVRELGGAWGPEFELLTLVGSAVVLVAVMGSRDLRVHLKRFVTRHFYSHGFDYRTEWLRFVETVSQPGAHGDSLQARVVRALAQSWTAPRDRFGVRRMGKALSRRRRGTGRSSVT